MNGAPTSIALSLVSHTNAGKTTLARTLLGRDIGEVRDAPHVTEFADVHTMLETPQGEKLLLWDTPGFGDSVRLAKRLRASSNPIGWFVSQIWDRWRDRPFWASQQAMRNVRDEADVVLYLVNASESPEGAGYVQPEMEVLGWVSKPVIVLLNQLGAPRETAQENEEIERWRQHLARSAHVRAVLPLDAFARCWVQEGALLHEIEAALSAERRGLMRRLRVAWWARRMEVFDASVRSLASSLARLAFAFEDLSESTNGKARLHKLGKAVGSVLSVVGSEAQSAAVLAQAALAKRLDAELRFNTAELIVLHGIEGRAQGEVLKRLSTRFDTRLMLSESKIGLLGGVVSGALGGLATDLASGGLTLGGGMLIGAVLGALSAAGLARCVNIVRGTDCSWVAWNAETLDQLVDAALLRYLAVAHFGRGRGEWAEGEAPPHWHDVAQRVLLPSRAELALIWKGRMLRDEHTAEQQQSVAETLEPILRRAIAQTLSSLYPNSVALGESAQGAPPASQ
jgi:GTPase SAR1 family protein